MQVYAKHGVIAYQAADSQFNHQKREITYI